mmetsp:Transcript_13468/g.28573  ORF Transcript_13468/g.28573 Transcript_13468/m.28573 type:complete len:311 (-) Transcript_13468:221-1153(-)
MHQSQSSVTFPGYRRPCCPRHSAHLALRTTNCASASLTLVDEGEVSSQHSESRLVKIDEEQRRLVAQLRIRQLNLGAVVDLDIEHGGRNCLCLDPFHLGHTPPAARRRGQQLISVVGLTLARRTIAAAVCVSVRMSMGAIMCATMSATLCAMLSRTVLLLLEEADGVLRASEVAARLPRHRLRPDVVALETLPLDQVLGAAVRADTRRDDALNLVVLALRLRLLNLLQLSSILEQVLIALFNPRGLGLAEAKGPGNLWPLAVGVNLLVAAIPCYNLAYQGVAQAVLHCMQTRWRAFQQIARDAVIVRPHN